MSFCATYGLLGLSEQRGFGFYVFPHSVSVVNGDQLPLSDGRLAVGATIPKQTMQTVPLQLVEKVKIGVEFELAGPTDHLTVQQIIDERLTRRCSHDRCGLPTRYAISYVISGQAWLKRTPKVPVCLLHLENFLPKAPQNWELWEFEDERRFKEGTNLGKAVFDMEFREVFTLEEYEAGDPATELVKVQREGKLIACFYSTTGVLKVRQPYFQQIGQVRGVKGTSVYFNADGRKRVCFFGIKKVKLLCIED